MNSIHIRGIKSVRSAFDILSDERLAKLFVAAETRDIMRRLGFKNLPRYERQRIAAIRKYFVDEVADDPIVPPIEPGAPVEPPVPPGNCQCVPASGLRWQKADRGEKITVSVDTTNAPKIQGSNVDHGALVTGFQHILDSGFKEFGIAFDVVSEGVGDVHITFVALDGLGGTLASTYLPATGERMDIQPWSGDIRFDTDEPWTTEKFATVFLHEMGHAIGIGHAPSFGNIMYPSYLGPRDDWGDWDSDELVQRYPKHA